MAGAPRAALRFGFRGFISEIREVARGVTAMVVGSGAWLGLLASGGGARNVDLDLYELLSPTERANGCLAAILFACTSDGGQRRFLSK